MIIIYCTTEDWFYTINYVYSDNDQNKQIKTLDFNSSKDRNLAFQEIQKKLPYKKYFFLGILFYKDSY